MFAKKTIFVWLPFFLVFLVSSIEGKNWKRPSYLPHESMKIKFDRILELSRRIKVADTWEFLKPVLIPRIVGTEGHRQVREFIKEKIQGLQTNWHIEEQEFEDETPFGTKTFTNLIATLNPGKTRQLVYSAHYDSKIDDRGEFLGAVDSALPIALILHIVTALDDLLMKHNGDVSLQLIFFDGEEAFVKWGPKDSTYGSRYLADNFENSFVTCDDSDDACKAVQESDDKISRLQAMDAFVLFDLLGSPAPSLIVMDTKSFHLHRQLIKIEHFLSENDELGNHFSPYFRKIDHNSRNYGIQDDHTPFQKRKVPILHMIPVPFPEVWHELADDYSALDKETSENLIKIFTVFTVKYLHLQE